MYHTTYKKEILRQTTLYTKSDLIELDKKEYKTYNVGNKN
jgi:hypothetical protein